MIESAILALGTAVPRFPTAQMAIGGWMTEAFGHRPALARWLRAIYARSPIECRYSCLPDFGLAASQSRFSPSLSVADSPTTAERMALYRTESIALGQVAARRAIWDRRDQLPITHLIAVSCTGFFAPGLDLALAASLGLAPDLRRSMIGFMGCAAAFNGLQLAAEISAASPRARVLVVCVELCTLHIQPGEDREALVAASLFGDGAAACVVGHPTAGSGDHLRLHDFHSRVTPSTESEMTWEIGNHGFALRLSPEVPKQLACSTEADLSRLLGTGVRPDFWAVHPGGPAILDRIESALQLGPADLEQSRAILRRYGNMSSATILFILEEVRRRLRANGRSEATGVAMAFGPGLVTELATISYRIAEERRAHA